MTTVLAPVVVLVMPVTGFGVTILVGIVVEVIVTLAVVL